MENEKLYAVMVEEKHTLPQLWNNYESAETKAKEYAIEEQKTSYVLVAVSKIEPNHVKISKL